MRRTRPWPSRCRFSSAAPGQNGDFPARRCVDLDTARRAAQAFVKKGQLEAGGRMGVLIAIVEARGFIIAGGRIVEIDAILDPRRIARLAGAALR